MLKMTTFVESVLLLCALTHFLVSGQTFSSQFDQTSAVDTVILPSQSSPISNTESHQPSITIALSVDTPTGHVSNGQTSSGSLESMNIRNGTPASASLQQVLSDGTSSPINERPSSDVLTAGESSQLPIITHPGSSSTVDYLITSTGSHAEHTDHLDSDRFSSSGTLEEESTPWPASTTNLLEDNDEQTPVPTTDTYPSVSGESLLSRESVGEQQLSESTTVYHSHSSASHNSALTLTASVGSVPVEGSTISLPISDSLTDANIITSNAPTTAGLSQSEYTAFFHATGIQLTSSLESHHVLSIDSSSDFQHSQSHVSGYASPLPQQNTPSQHFASEIVQMAESSETTNVNILATSVQIQVSSTTFELTDDSSALGVMSLTPVTQTIDEGPRSYENLGSSLSLQETPASRQNDFSLNILPQSYSLDTATTSLGDETETAESRTIFPTGVVEMPNLSSSEVDVLREKTADFTPSSPYMTTSPTTFATSANTADILSSQTFFSDVIDFVSTSTDQPDISSLTSDTTSLCSYCQLSAASYASDDISLDASIHLVTQSIPAVETQSGLFSSALVSDDLQSSGLYGDSVLSVSPMQASATQNLFSASVQSLSPSSFATLTLLNATATETETVLMLPVSSMITEDILDTASQLFLEPSSALWTSHTLQPASSSVVTSNVSLELSTVTPSLVLSGITSFPEATTGAVQRFQNETSLVSSENVPSFPSIFLSEFSVETSLHQSYQSSSLIFITQRPPHSSLVSIPSDSVKSTSVEPSSVLSTTSQVITTTKPTAATPSDILISFTFIGDCEKLREKQSSEKVTKMLLQFIFNITHVPGTSTITIGKSLCNPNSLPVMFEDVDRIQLFSRLNQTFLLGPRPKGYQISLEGLPINITGFDELFDKPFQRGGNEVAGADVAVIATASCICVILVAAGIVVFAREMYLKKISEQFTFPDSPRLPLKTENVALSSIPKHASVYNDVEMSEERRAEGGYCNNFDVEYSTIDNQMKTNFNVSKKTIPSSQNGVADSGHGSQSKTNAQNDEAGQSATSSFGGKTQPPSGYGLVIGLSGFTKTSMKDQHLQMQEQAEEDPTYAVIDKKSKFRGANIKNTSTVSSSPASATSPCSPSTKSSPAPIDDGSAPPSPRHLRTVGKTGQTSDSHEALLPQADASIAKAGEASESERGVDNPMFAGEKGGLTMGSTHSFHF